MNGRNLFKGADEPREQVTEEPREQVERELTGLVETLIGEIKSLAEAMSLQQQQINRLELAIAGRKVR